ncbi:SIR2 family NAD-dependent protein deacylase [Geodermatophilus sp. URMC 62]|uniref:SIR2 family NAD-dependent protein deacylase n=1 Tax=Geodermatophilus sp. URMC 62 TaxID=3423414 RepID=UPI00406CC867
MPDDPAGVYRLIAKRLLKGKVVPVLGAGVNLCERPPEATFQKGRFLPNGQELAMRLAADYSVTETRDLAQVAQYIAAVAGQGPLYDELHDVFDADYPPTRLHRFLARLSRLTRELNSQCMLFVTTNYDDLLERAFAEEGEPYELVTYIAEGRDRGRFRHFRSDGKVVVIDRPNKYIDLRLDRSPVIAKIHGAVDRENHLDSFVITEDHYIDYLTRADVGGLFPVDLGKKMMTSHLLFLGYSLRDWNLRVMLYRLWGEQQGKEFKSWAIQPDPNPIDECAWDERGVDILSIGCERFLDAIEAEIEGLRPSGFAEAS